jgi:hypothetical protein
MRARQKRPKTAVDQCLSILFRNTRDLELQLFELNKLRYQVWHRPGIEPGRTPEPAGQTPHQRESCRGYPLISARSHPTIGIELPISALGLIEHRGGRMMTAIEAGLISVLGDNRAAGLAQALAPIGRQTL